MKTKLAVFLCLFSILIGIQSVSAQQPDYEKYGRIAIAVVKEDYPGDQVREYKYVGRTKVNETAVMDKFSFQLTENGKPITVEVNVNHSLKNNKLLSLTVAEQKQ